MLLSESGLIAVRHRFVTDFREYVAAAQPADWTKRGATTTPVWSVTDDGATAGGKRLGFSSPAAPSTTLGFDPPGQPTDGEILCLIKTGASTTAGVDNISPAMRIATGSDTAYSASLMRNAAVNGGNLSLLFSRTNVANTLAVTFVWGANTRYWIRFRIVGTAVTVKCWAFGTAEPAASQISTTDANLASGYVGACCTASSVNPQGSMEFFSFVAGTGSAGGLSG